MSPHDVTKAFEEEIGKYTGAPYVVCVDNASNALFLALTYDNIVGKGITIPSHTYPSVPCEIIHAHGMVWFYPSPPVLKGAYPLVGSRVVDSALRFTKDMYERGTFMCCSFTGPKKHLNLGKGGCILTDNERAYRWFKRARYSGRNECSYLEDQFDMIGWNFYMNPMVAALGLLNMGKFYRKGIPLEMPDVEMEYPDLSRWPVFGFGRAEFEDQVIPFL